MSGLDTDEGLGSSSYLRNTLDIAQIDVQENQLFCVCELCGEQMEYRDAMDHAMKHQQQVVNSRPRPPPPPPPYDNHHSPGACGRGPANNLPTTITENVRPSSVDSDDSGIVVNGSGSESATVIANAANTVATAPVQPKGMQTVAENVKGAKRSRRSPAEKNENGKRKRARKEPAKSMPNANANQMPVQQNYPVNYPVPPAQWQNFPARPAAPSQHHPQQRNYPHIRQCLETTTRMVVRHGTTWYPSDPHQPPPLPYQYHPSAASQYGFQPNPHHQIPPQGAVRSRPHNQRYYPYALPPGAHHVPAHLTRSSGPHEAAHYQANYNRPAHPNRAHNNVPNAPGIHQRQLQSSMQTSGHYPASVPMHHTQSSMQNFHRPQNHPPRSSEALMHRTQGQYQNQQVPPAAINPQKQSEVAPSDDNSRQSNSDDSESPALPLAEAVYDPSLIYNCEFCSQRFTTALEIRTHTRDDHRILKDYVWCNVCGLRFDGGTDHLHKHIQSVHAKINDNANWW